MLPTFSINLKSSRPDIMKKIASIINSMGDSEINREWTTDAYLKIVEGKNDSDVMNLSGYSHTCERNSKISKGQKKEISILNQDEIDQGNQGLLDIPIDNTTSSVEEAVNGLDSEYWVQEFIKQREIIFLSRGSDIWRLFQLTRQGDVAAGSKLRVIVEESGLSEMMTYIVTNQVCLRRLDDLLC